MSCSWYSQHLNGPYQAWKRVQRGDFELMTMIIGKITWSFDLMYKLFLNHLCWFNALFWFSTRKSGCHRILRDFAGRVKRFSIISKRIREVNVHYWSLLHIKWLNLISLALFKTLKLTVLLNIGRDEASGILKQVELLSQLVMWCQGMATHLFGGNKIWFNHFIF